MGVSQQQTSRMREKSIAAALLAVIVVIGCDPMYGVQRHARVPYIPARDDVLARVRGVPGIDEIRCEGPSREGAGVALNCSYRGGPDVDAILQFIEESPGHVRYTQHVARMGAPPPQRVVDATLPVMHAVEARLATLPGFEGLPGAAVQRCEGVKCP